MQIVSSIDPVTRLEGHMKVEITVDTVNGVQKVVDAKSVGTMFRGFEKILVGRDPRDARHITERICGVCPVSHAMAAVIALDQAYKVSVPNNARLMRNLVMGANFIDSHILHFYLLALPDFINGPAMPPWQPSWATDKRISGTQATALVNNYIKAIEMRRKANEMAAIFGGRLPHPPTYISGGFTTFPDAAGISKFKTYLTELISFIQNVYIPDVEYVASIYSDYFGYGRGYANLLAFGCFEQDATWTNRFFKRGIINSGAGSVLPLDVNAIREQVTWSWYDNATNDKNPASGDTVPMYPKTNAYSWLKAPRLGGKPYETGPLARMWMNGFYRSGVSVMDRHKARAQEALKIAQSLQSWITQLKIGDKVYVEPVRTSTATAIGLTEAPRGALGHWVQVRDGKVARYQVLTPTCWNASPRDTAGQTGPLEKSLIGLPVKNIKEPVEVIRTIHSFDPCLDCAVHVARPAEGAKIFHLGHIHSEEDAHHAQAHEHGHGHEHGHDHPHH